VWPNASTWMWVDLLSQGHSVVDTFSLCVSVYIIAAIALQN